MEDQKKVDAKAVKEKMAVSHDTKGGKHAMSKINPQKPDQLKPNRPNFGGIRYIGD